MTAHPFIKWAGGKTQLLPELRRRVPVAGPILGGHQPADFGRYWEPFVGAGAMLFDLADRFGLEHLVGEQQTWATINDSNAWLTTTYKAIRSNVRGVVAYLKEYEASYRKRGAEFYYEVRKRPHAALLVDQAATFIFLNKTCFNGLYRVNKKGGFNSPFGKYENPTICDEENIRACSAGLAKAGSLHVGDFASVLDDAGPGDRAVGGSVAQFTLVNNRRYSAAILSTCCEEASVATKAKKRLRAEVA